MADLPDVEHALVRVALQAVYPNGVPANKVSPTVGTPVRLMRGLPVQELLDSDVAKGIVDIAVYSDKGMHEDTSRFDEEWRTLVDPVTTLTVTSAPNTVTFGGVAGVPQVVGCRPSGPGSPGYSALMSPSDGPEQAAAALAILVPGASADGPVLTVPDARQVLGRVSGFGTLISEARRQQQVIRVICLCGSPEMRDAVCAVVDAAFAPLDWIPLPDGTSARVSYRGTEETDAAISEGVWRRDLIYAAEYPSVATVQAPAIMWGVAYRIEADVSGEQLIGAA